MKNARHGLDNPNARFRKETSVDDVLASPVVSDPLRLLDICATSDGAAALIVASKSFAEKHLGSLDGVPSVRAVSTVTPRYPQHLPELPDIATDSTAVVAGPERAFKDQILDAAYAEAGIGPEDLSLAEVYDLSTALELDWYEHLGLCAKGEAEQLLRSGATTDRRPHPGQPVGRAGLLRRGHPGAGHRPGLRADLAAEGPGGRPPGRGREGRRHREPGPVRPRLVGDRRAVTRSHRLRPTPGIAGVGVRARVVTAVTHVDEWFGDVTDGTDGTSGFSGQSGDAEVRGADAVVGQQVSRDAGTGHRSGLQDVRPVGAGQRLLRVLLHQQDRGALLC